MSDSPLDEIPSWERQRDAVLKSASDTLAAKLCMKYFALRIRHEMSLDDFLADHIATALEAAAAAAASECAKVLTDALHLTANRARPHANELLVYDRVQELVSTGRSVTAASAIAAKEFGIDKRTVGRHLKIMEKALSSDV